MTIVPAGAITVHRAQRAAVGRDGRVDARPAAAKATALTVTASTALTLPGRCGSVPVKSNVISSPAIGHRHARCATGTCWSGAGPEAVEHVGEAPRAVGQRGQRGPHAPLAVGEHLVAAARRPSAARRATPTTLAPTWASRSPARSSGVRELASSSARTSAVSRTGGRRRPSCEDLDGVGRHRAGRGAADVGVVGPVGGPADQRGRRREHGVDHGDVVEVGAAGERVVEDDLLARRRRVRRRTRVDGGRAPTPASTRGAPGCARPGPAARPSAVNSAAEQSARSLMFGLNAARRSTAPISSATPVRREHEDLQRRPGRGSRVGSSPGSARSAPAAPGSARQPAGTQIVQSGSAITAGPDRGGALERAGRSASADRRRPRRADGPHGDHLDRDVGPGVAVAALVLGRGTPSTVGTVSSWLWPA